MYRNYIKASLLIKNYFASVQNLVWPQAPLQVLIKAQFWRLVAPNFSNEGARLYFFRKRDHENFYYAMLSRINTG